MSTTLHVDGNDNNVATLPDLEAGATVQVDAVRDDATSSELVATTLCRFLQSFVPGAPLSREQLVSSLFWISSLTLILGATAVFYVPATGPVFGPCPAAYYTTLVVSLAAAAVELGAAYWLSCSDRRGALALAKFVMRYANQVFIVVLSMSGFGILFAREGLPVH